MIRPDAPRRRRAAAARRLRARRRLGRRLARRVRPGVPRAGQRVRRRRRQHRLPARARAPVPGRGRRRPRRRALAARARARRSARDPARMAIAGDSAGGNLAAVTARRLRDDGGSPLRFQALIYPVCDSALNTPSYRDKGDGFGLSALEHEALLGALPRRRRRRASPDASPLRAADLAGLPPGVRAHRARRRAARRGGGLRARARVGRRAGDAPPLRRRAARLLPLDRARGDLPPRRRRRRRARSARRSPSRPSGRAPPCGP